MLGQVKKDEFHGQGRGENLAQSCPEQIKLNILWVRVDL